MTFEEFFSANHKDIPGIDRNTQALMRVSARAAYANCWNAAIDEAMRCVATRPISVESLKNLKVFPK